MTELELVGYTADMQYLVLSDPNRRGSRWHVPIDEDLLDTAEELVQDEPRPGAAHEALSTSNGVPGSGPLAAVAAAAGERNLRSVRRAGGDRSPPSPSSRLSPRQIQALLRAGKSPRSVAKQAETDEAWVRRWLPPIESERQQVLRAVWASSVSKARLGRSHDLVGEAVRKNLSAKGVEPDSNTVRWSATRKEAETVWTVTLRFRNRGSSQRAVWHFDPDRNVLEPRNQLAVDIAWTRPRQASRSSGSGQATAPRKTAASKKAAGKKTAGKKAAGKKTAAKKASGKKASSKKTSGKKSGAKKAAASKSGADKSAANANAAPEQPPGGQDAAADADAPSGQDAAADADAPSGQDAAADADAPSGPDTDAAPKRTRRG